MSPLSEKPIAYTAWTYPSYIVLIRAYCSYLRSGPPTVVFEPHKKLNRITLGAERIKRFFDFRKEGRK